MDFVSEPRTKRACEKAAARAEEIARAVVALTRENLAGRVREGTYLEREMALLEEFDGLLGLLGPDAERRPSVLAAAARADSGPNS